MNFSIVLKLKRNADDFAYILKEYTLQLTMTSVPPPGFLAVVTNILLTYGTVIIFVISLFSSRSVA